jgi:hypothetical protein
MSLSHNIFSLPPEEQKEAIMSLAKKRDPLVNLRTKSRVQQDSSRAPDVDHQVFTRPRTIFSV